MLPVVWPYDSVGRLALTVEMPRFKSQIRFCLTWLTTCGECVDTMNWQFGNVSCNALTTRRCQEG